MVRELRKDEALVGKESKEKEVSKRRESKVKIGKGREGGRQREGGEG